MNNVTVVNSTPQGGSYTSSTPRCSISSTVSGEVLPANTTFPIAVPAGAVNQIPYPLPDLPVYAFTNNYTNVTKV